MSDFLISFDVNISASDLLEFLRLPYGGLRRNGMSWKFTWGAVAVLEDVGAGGGNILEQEGGVGGWVGDLPSGPKDVRKLLADFVANTPHWHSATDVANALAQNAATANLNGASAVMLANQRFVCVITDPMSAVQLYAASPKGAAVTAIGTHPDLVAESGGEAASIDPISVAEFIDQGTPCWPHTMYRNVSELQAGHVFVCNVAVGQARSFSSTSHWLPPREFNGKISPADVADEFGTCWQASVRERCHGKRVGVQLSGGLDSRIVMAAIPRDTDCVGLTYCDGINRETRIARRVAELYGREWKPLFRDPEYLAQTATDAIRFTGCEGEWHHAHAIGFQNEIDGLGVDALFTGLYMDNNFKGYYARDLVRQPRLKGLLPALYRYQPLDYASHLSDFCRSHITSEIQETMVERRRRFYAQHFARGRQSEWEWLDGHPLAQASDNTGWIVERRLFPLRLPVNDRRLVDLAFRIPAQWKAGGRFFEQATVKVLGPGLKISNANNGVRPGSGYLSRLLQRSTRKVQTLGHQALGRLGARIQVPHSWHDYQKYWQESQLLEQLRSGHGQNLCSFEELPFATQPDLLLRRSDIPWRIGCRLVQLALWISILSEYRKNKIFSTSAPSPQPQFRT